VIREYEPRDAEFLRAMHAADPFDYALPDLANQLWITKQVLEVEGRVVMALLGRLTSEAYLLEDPAERERAGRVARMRRILSLAEASAGDARSRGIDSAHAWLAPEIAGKFGPQLERMGWLPARWAAYVKEL
jgi:hypothetical protein